MPKSIITCKDCQKIGPLAAKGRCAACNSKAWARAHPERRRQSSRDGARRRRKIDPAKFRYSDKVKYAKNKEQICLDARKYRARMPWAKRLLAGQNGRGRQNLTQDYLEGLKAATLYCSAECGRLLDYGFFNAGKIPLNFATLDKIVPSLGYEKGNIAILCLECNRLKDKMTIEDARRIVRYIEKHT